MNKKLKELFIVNKDENFSGYESFALKIFHSNCEDCINQVEFGLAFCSNCKFFLDKNGEWINFQNGQDLSRYKATKNKEIIQAINELKIAFEKNLNSENVTKCFDNLIKKLGNYIDK